jgi:hypothetical protein
LEWVDTSHWDNSNGAVEDVEENGAGGERGEGVASTIEVAY